ncbi:flagellar basal body-associated protein FliL [Pseudomonas mandelii JR-1]|uniref:Flagellar basal body-associated protein FliL n=1 Tax=Pseudomonas mandelii JR-1 TaxID=1147786 RepID=A0A024EI92_9PSED|nr:flagellar basal body-associated protein FliL [Pseudomonas mandelii JR-1]
MPEVSRRYGRQRKAINCRSEACPRNRRRGLSAIPRHCSSRTSLAPTGEV